MKELQQNALTLFGVRLTANQIAAFECFENELLEWNERFNLTAIQEAGQVRTKHFLDSLSCIPILRESLAESDQSPRRLIDVGTGAGFPGIPLKIALPSIRLTLVESVSKKASFCQHIVQTLKLDGVEILQERAENLGVLSGHRQQYDWALARAVARMPVLMEYLLPLVRVGGTVVAMKGENAPAEAHAGENALRILGGRFRRLIPVTLPGVAEQRYLVVVDKIAATPNGYPRRVGLPAKKPL